MSGCSSDRVVPPTGAGNVVRRAGSPGSVVSASRAPEKTRPFVASTGQPSDFRDGQRCCVVHVVVMLSELA